jgi:hypothetical protein
VKLEDQKELVELMSAVASDLLEYIHSHETDHHKIIHLLRILTSLEATIWMAKGIPSRETTIEDLRILESFIHLELKTSE